MSHPLTGSGGPAVRTPRPVRAPMSPRISVRPSVAFALSGLIVFAITGLFGYISKPGPYLGLNFSSVQAFLDTLFRKPWLLFGWLCALIFTLQAAILRQQPLTEQRRRQQRWTYAVTGVCIILVALIDLAGGRILTAIANFIDWIGQIIGNAHGILFQVIASPWFYTVVNFGVIAWLAIRAGQRALRLRGERARLRTAHDEAPPDRQLAIEKRLDQLPEMHELVLGDLLVRSAIVLLLSFAVRYELLSSLNVIPLPPRGDKLPVFNSCSVALPGRCPPLYTDTLSFYDLIIALFGLVTGVALAAVSAQAEAQAETDQAAETLAADHIHAEADTPGTDPLAPGLDGDLPTVRARSFGRLGHAAADKLLDILIRPFERVGSEQNGEPSPYDPLAVLRSLGWPLLILGGTAAAGALARETLFALHRSPFSAVPLPTISLPIGGAYNPVRLVHEVLAVVMGLLALAGIIGSAWVLTRDHRVRLAGLAFVKENGVITLILFCAYSLALWLLQILLSALSRHAPDPYHRLDAFNPGFLTVASLALLLWFGLPILWKRFGSNPPRR